MEGFDAGDDGVFGTVDESTGGLRGVTGYSKRFVETDDVVLLVFPGAGNGAEVLKSHSSYRSFVLLRFYLDKRPYYYINSSARSEEFLRTLHLFDVF